jgi:hypothetical protein
MCVAYIHGDYKEGALPYQRHPFSAICLFFKLFTGTTASGFERGFHRFFTPFLNSAVQHFNFI